MNTEAINIKIDSKTKKAAQELAEDLGFSLSSIMKAYLRHFIKTKTIHFSAKEEIPSDFLLDTMRKSNADMKAGRYVEFDNIKDEIAYLDGLIADAKNRPKN